MKRLGLFFGIAAFIFIPLIVTLQILEGQSLSLTAAPRSKLNINCVVVIPPDLDKFMTFHHKDGEKIILNAHEMYRDAYHEGWREYLKRFQSGEIDLDEINKEPYLRQEWGLSMSARYEGFMNCRQGILDYAKGNQLEYKPLKDKYTKQLLNSGADIEYPGSSSHLDSEPIGISLRGGDITDKQLEPIRHFRELTSLDITGTSVSDKGLEHIKHLNNLWKLELAGTRITDEGIKQLLEFKKLEWLDLSNTAVTDKGVSMLSALQNLDVIDLSGTSITDESIESLSNLPNLRCLDLDQAADESFALQFNFNQSSRSLDVEMHPNHPRKIIDPPRITDASVETFKKMKKLESLSLEGASISDEGIEQLQKVIPNLRK